MLVADIGDKKCWCSVNHRRVTYRKSHQHNGPVIKIANCHYHYAVNNTTGPSTTAVNNPNIDNKKLCSTRKSCGLHSFFVVLAEILRVTILWFGLIHLYH